MRQLILVMHRHNPQPPMISHIFNLGERALHFQELNEYRKGPDV